MKGGSLASALILRMIYKGNLSVSKDVKGKVEIMFSEKATDGLDEASLGLYNMMLEASGSDKVLQDKEFSKWSGSHEKRVHDWIGLCDRQARARLAANHFGRPDTYTKAGSQFYGLIEAIVVAVGDTAGKTVELSRMGRKDNVVRQLLNPRSVIGNNIERVGIDDNRTCSATQLGDERNGSLLTCSQSGTYCHGVVALCISGL